jgi:hypothetical protein
MAALSSERVDIHIMKERPSNKTDENIQSHLRKLFTNFYYKLAIVMRGGAVLGAT